MKLQNIKDKEEILKGCRKEGGIYLQGLIISLKAEFSIATIEVRRK